MPFNLPFGTRSGMEKAQALVQAAVAEANKRGWPKNFAVVDPGGNLVAFARMDGAQLASIAIAEHKARTAARYRRPTIAFRRWHAKSRLELPPTLDDVIASRGGIPLVEDGKIIGAIGCSGGTGSQDEALCEAAIDGGYEIISRSCGFFARHIRSQVSRGRQQCRPRCVTESAMKRWRIDRI